MKRAIRAEAKLFGGEGSLKRRRASWDGSELIGAHLKVLERPQIAHRRWQSCQPVCAQIVGVGVFWSSLGGGGLHLLELR